MTLIDLLARQIERMRRVERVPAHSRKIARISPNVLLLDMERIALSLEAAYYGSTFRMTLKVKLPSALLKSA